MAWTEQDYRAAGFVTIKVRLDPTVAGALDALAHEQDSSRTEAVSKAILDAYEKTTRARKKTA